MSDRPLSPHLSVYRLVHTLVLSILHRLSGIWVSLGLCALIYWLASAAAGEGDYARATALFATWYVRLLLWLWLAAYCYHFVAGLRHLAWDAGFGLERVQLRRGAWLVTVTALLAFVLLGYFLFWQRTGVT